MLQKPIVVLIVSIMVIAVVVLVVGLYNLTGTVAVRTAEFQRAIAVLQDSLRTIQAEVDSLRGRTPGLGEYMSTFQLHIAKMWFAVHASNWDLANYELGELEETIEAAESLHAIKNAVNISSVLQSVRQTQAILLEQAMKKHDQQKFASAYNQTLEACNSCHRSVSFGFIHITKPMGQPVMNQRWDIAQ
jgi:hypothetical protein